MKITPNQGNEKQRVFLVDDHPLVREWLTNLVNQQAELVVCGEAATASEALQMIPPSKPAVAVVDISLKDSPGIEWIKRLKQTFPNLLILVFSMHDESLYAERVLQAGARGYIMKCEATKNVIEAIRRVLAGKFYLSDTMSQTITTHFVEGKILSTHSPIERLSDRELAVFDKLGQGLGTRQIASLLGVSIKTVQAHCVRMKEKLNVNSASELVREAVRHHEAEITNLR